MSNDMLTLYSPEYHSQNTEIFIQVQKKLFKSVK